LSLFFIGFCWTILMTKCTTSIIWPRLGTVHIYDLAHFCNSVCVFQWNRICVGLWLFFLYIFSTIDDLIIKRGLAGPQFVLDPIQDMDFHRHMFRSFYVLLFEMSDGCSLCWYWCNWWSSLFKKRWKIPKG
jgi:hypothetical protein